MTWNVPIATRHLPADPGLYTHKIVTVGIVTAIVLILVPILLAIFVFMTPIIAHAADMKASFYDEPQLLPNGRPYNPLGMTAAHRTLPIGTPLTVCFKPSRRCVVLAINDYGPAEWTKREIDLSAGAKKALRFPGLGKVRVAFWPPLPKARPLVQ